MNLTDDQIRSLRALAETEPPSGWIWGTTTCAVERSVLLSLVEEVERQRAMRPARIAGVTEVERENARYEAAFEAIEHAPFGDKQNRSRDDLEMRAAALAAKAEAGKALERALMSAKTFIECHPAVQGEWPILVGLIDAALARWREANG